MKDKLKTIFKGYQRRLQASAVEITIAKVYSLLLSRPGNTPVTGRTQCDFRQ